MKRNPVPPEVYDEVLKRDVLADPLPYTSRHIPGCRLAAGMEGRTAYPHDCTGRLELQHTLPRGMGGTPDPAVHHPDRLVMLCTWAHDFVERQERTWAYDNGWLERRTANL